MIGFLPQPDGLSAPRSYGNPHNQSRPSVANRVGGNIGISRRPPNFAPQSQQRIGVQQNQQPAFNAGQSMPQQQPPYNFGGGMMGMMQPPQFFQQSQPAFFQGIGQPRRGQSHLSFGRQYQ